MARDTTLGSFMTVGPLTARSPGRIAATAASRGEPKFLPIDVSETIAKKHPLRIRRRFRQHFQSSPARPEDKIDTVSNHLIIAPRSLSDRRSAPCKASVQRTPAARP
jgi:hypothetical protein